MKRFFLPYTVIFLLFSLSYLQASQHQLHWRHVGDSGKRNPVFMFNDAIRGTLFKEQEKNFHYIKQFIEDHGANHTDFTGRSSLYTALVGGNHSIVNFLLRKGANPNTTDSVKHSSLYRAVKTGNHHCVTDLIRYGVAQEESPIKQDLLLQRAAKTGNSSIICALIMYNYVSKKDISQKTISSAKTHSAKSVLRYFQQQWKQTEKEQLNKKKQKKKRKRKRKEEEEEEEEDFVSDCVICLDTFTKKERKTIKKLKKDPAQLKEKTLFECNHSVEFHNYCIKTWAASFEKTTCPLCRSEKKKLENFEEPEREEEGYYADEHEYYGYWTSSRGYSHPS